MQKSVSDCSSVSAGLPAMWSPNSTHFTPGTIFLRRATISQWRFTTGDLVSIATSSGWKSRTMRSNCDQFLRSAMQSTHTTSWPLLWSSVAADAGMHGYR